MKIRQSTLFVILLLSLTQIGYSQTAKSLYKEGKDFLDAANYDKAVESFTASLALKPDYEKSFESRADAYEKLNKFTEAANDYKELIKLDPKEETWYLGAGRNLMAQGDLEGALFLLEKATVLDSKLLDAYLLKFEGYFRLSNFEKAKEAIVKTIDINPEKASHYYKKAVVCDSLKQIDEATLTYEKTLLSKYEQRKVYISYVNMLLREKKYSNAKEVVERALASFSEETEFYFQRAEVYRQKLDYPSAINDISRVTILDPYSTRAFMTRGHLNKEFNQFQAAIADYGKVISLDSHNYAAYFYRGSCFQEISNKADAIADLSVITNAEKKLSSAEEIEILVKAKSRLFELKREKNPPSIALDVPKMENLSIKIPANKTTVLLDGIINDENDIAAATLNGVTLQLVNKRFLIEISIGDAKELLFDATDVYGNQSRTHIDIKRNEVDPPVIKLLSPFASENHEVYLESNAKSIYVEGIAQDENLITQISVNGINASYVPGDKNPKFSVTIPIDGVKQIDVEATDAFGNKAIYTYNINRDAAMMMQANPMGKTWVVFIENSNYETFASLEGPTKDIVLMKNAIANYQVNNLIHKKDLSKKQLERFFSIELRDLIRSNHVNSLVVWYAGHGKFINETGYWIPVDAKRDDEFTYFNINNLKAAMQSYSNEITHTLVITDACESGPTFYQAMRAMGGKRSCDDPQATRFRSSQVFSSAGYELAADNSQFTKAFAKALEVNESSCLSIDEVVQTVTNAVKGNKQQSPQFGKIAGLEDENGTFFFMRK